jgi:hypothetical protein
MCVYKQGEKVVVQILIPRTACSREQPIDRQGCGIADRGATSPITGTCYQWHGPYPCRNQGEREGRQSRRTSCPNIPAAGMRRRNVLQNSGSDVVTLSALTGVTTRFIGPASSCAWAS